jgi:uncharacterized protein YraI
MKPIALLLSLIMLLSLTPPVHAQSGDVEARVVANRLNVRQSPGTGAPVVGQFAYGAVVRVTGRAGDGVWVYATPPDDDRAGWVHSGYLDFPAGFAMATLPVIATPATAGPSAPSGDAAPGTGSGVISNVGPRAREIFLHGQQLGNRADAFAKIGDSITHTQEFLFPIGGGYYRLGGYAHLQAVIDHFAGSFARYSLGARAGWTSANLLDPGSADPAQCAPGESPLECEYRVHRPAIALILVGTNDISQGMDPATYRANLERIVQTSIDRGVIPVLSTIPDNLSFPPHGQIVPQFNAVVREVAAGYGIPLWEYWGALQALPNKGLGPDNYHPSSGGADAIFTAANLNYGYTVRNLGALLALDAVWRGALE